MKKTATIFFAALTLFYVFIQESSADNDYEVPEKAIEYIEQGDFVQAQKELKKFQRSQPDNPLVYYYLARIEEEHNKALWLYKEVEILADSTLASEALYRRAEMVFSTGNYADAQRLYEHLVNKYPGSAFLSDALYRMGIISLKGKKPSDAIDYFDRSIELDADGEKRVYASAGIMESYVMLEEWNKALEFAHDVLREKDEVSAFTPRVLEVIALSWRKLGNDENADVFTERLLKNYPYSYQAYAIRAEGNRIASDSGYFFDSRAAVSGTEEAGETVQDNGANEKNANFSIQLGAFEMRNNALRMLRKLKNAGFEARVDMKTGEDIHFFVVRVGYFVTREDADNLVKQINNSTGIKGNVVILNK